MCWSKDYANVQHPWNLQLIQQDHEEVQGLFEQFHKSVSAKDGEEKADPISKQI